MDEKLKNKYGGDIDINSLQEYFKHLINRLWKILPMKEQNCLTLDKYLFNLRIELMGGESILLNSGLFIELINNLESLSGLDKKEEYKPQIFKCINICEKIINKLGG
jgi:hypothetical protein